MVREVITILFDDTSVEIDYYSSVTKFASIEEAIAYASIRWHGATIIVTPWGIDW